MIAQSLQADRENPGLFRWGEPFYWITQTITWHTGVESDLKYLPPQGTSVCGSTSGFSLGVKKKKKRLYKWSTLKFLQKTSVPPEINRFLLYLPTSENLPEINWYLVYLPTCQRTPREINWFLLYLPTCRKRAPLQPWWLGRQRENCEQNSPVSHQPGVLCSRLHSWA